MGLLTCEAKPAASNVQTTARASGFIGVVGAADDEDGRDGQRRPGRIDKDGRQVRRSVFYSAAARRTTPTRVA